MTAQEALRQYRVADDISIDGTSCYSLTPRLIERTQLSDRQAELVNALDNAFHQAVPTDVEIKLYRVAPRDFIAQTNMNQPYSGFISTSTDFSECISFISNHKDPVFVEITCPPGSKIIKVADNNMSNLEQNEVMLPRNSVFTFNGQDTTPLPMIPQMLLGDIPRYRLTLVL